NAYGFVHLNLSDEMLELVAGRGRAVRPRKAMSDPTPIKRFAPFDPERIREIIRAFDEACSALQPQPPSDKARDILAKRITELAQYGEQSHERLRDQALEYLNAVCANGAEATNG